MAAVMVILMPSNGDGLYVGLWWLGDGWLEKSSLKRGISKLG